MSAEPDIPLTGGDTRKLISTQDEIMRRLGEIETVLNAMNAALGVIMTVLGEKGPRHG